MGQFHKESIHGNIRRNPFFEADSIESCRVPKTNLNHIKSPLFERVTNRNDFEKEFLKEIPIQAIQYQRECTLPKAVFKRPLTCQLPTYKNRLLDSAIPLLEAIQT